MSAEKNVYIIATARDIPKEKSLLFYEEVHKYIPQMKGMKLCYTPMGYLNIGIVTVGDCEKEIGKLTLALMPARYTVTTGDEPFSGLIDLRHSL